MATILVTGASGFVGSWFVPSLADAGHQVRALVRDAAGAGIVSARLAAGQRGSVSTVIGDVTSWEGLGTAIDGVDAVVHLVALPRDRSGGRDLMRVNLGGTRNIIAAMEKAGVRRLIHQGALGVTDDATLHYARSKAQAEAAVSASGLEWTILKPSLLFGERDGFFNIIADLVRPPLGAVPVPARQRSLFQPLWIGDLARILVDVVSRPDTVGRSYELGGPDRLTYRQMVQAVISAMGARRVIVPVPLTLIKLVARASEMVHLPFPVASDQLRQLSFDNITALDSVEREFGFRPRAMTGGLAYLQRRAKQQDPASRGG
ncbi:MAG: complex I NDUFA9 subunit family protein [Chloroflexi bacterium]|nr:complex I NDUFA9 subunit family protein [Chloroflexota bacterium]